VITVKLDRIDRKGQSMIGTITAVITAMVVISIGVIISEELITSQYDNFGVNVTNPSQAQQGAAGDVDLQGGFNATRDMIGSGFTVLPVLLIVLAAIPVIDAVLYLGR